MTNQNITPGHHLAPSGKGSFSVLTGPAYEEAVWKQGLEPKPYFSQEQALKQMSPADKAFLKKAQEAGYGVYWHDNKSVMLGPALFKNQKDSEKDLKEKKQAEERKKNPSWLDRNEHWVAIGGITVVIATAVAGIFLLRNKNKKRKNSNTNSTQNTSNSTNKSDSSLLNIIAANAQGTVNTETNGSSNFLQNGQNIRN